MARIAWGKSLRTAWLGVALALIGALLLSSCGDDDDDGAGGGEDPVEVAFFGPAGNTYVEATLRGMEAVGSQRGANITRFDTGFDPSKQFGQLQDAVTQQKFDAFIVIPLDSAGLVPAAQEAIDAGIEVVNTDLVLGQEFDTSEPQVEGQAGSVVNPPSDRAENMIGLIVQACADLDPCKVGFIAGEPSIDFERRTKELLDDLPSEEPNIEIAAYQTGHGYVAEPAVGIAQNMLQANPDLNVLMTSSDQASAGAEDALKDAGRTDEVSLLSSGGSCPAVEAVTEGRWYGTVIDLPETEGRIGMEMAIDAVRGKGDGPRGVNPLDTIDRPDPWVTKDNLGGFKCQWKG